MKLFCNFMMVFIAMLMMPCVTLNAAEEKDEHGIIISPADGVRKVYTRSGMMYVNDPVEGMQTKEQSGTIQIIECPNGDVYIRNILCSYPTGTWVKGTRTNNVITVPTRQPIYWNAEAGVTFSLNWGVCEESWGSLSFSLDGRYNEIKFVVNDVEKTMTLENSSSENFIGVFWDDDDSFAWHGDWETVWTYSHDFEPMQEVTVTAPDGLTTENWYVRGHKRVGENDVLYNGNVTIGFLGNDIYMKGLFADFPDAWIKGTYNEGTYTFNGLQVQGTNGGQTYYAVGSEAGDLVPFVMYYNADDRVFTSRVALITNTSKTDISAGEWYTDLKIQKTDPNAPITVLPWVNTINTKDDFEWFAVVDANSDEYSWHFYQDEEYGCASYKYNSENPADDWLISPAIRLEAGKTYNFSLDAKCSSEAYPEQIEVKLGNAQTAESMTTEVIASTEIASEDPQQLSNILVTVNETGNYYFGVHAISEADRGSLRVMNMKVGETILTAPGEVTDLTVVPNAEEKKVKISFNAPTKNVGGEQLMTNMNIDVLKDGEMLVEFNNVAPGNPVEYTEENVEPGKHVYTVVARNDDGEGASVSQSIVVTAVFEVPYTAAFNEEGVYDVFTIIDANDDNATWNDIGTSAEYEYSSINAADDYLISPAIRLEVGKRYNIAVDAEAAGDYPERYEVLIGKGVTVDALTTTVIEPQEIIGSQMVVQSEGIFECAETGTYNVAIHAISDADKYNLLIYKLVVEVAPALTAPAAPELTATAGDKGAKSASISVKAPEKSIDGNTLTANVTKIEILRDGEIVKTFENVAPGSVNNFVDDAEELTTGNHTYQAIPYNADGIGAKSERVTVFIGVDVPLAVIGVKALDQKTKVLVTWEKTADTGVNGGYVDAENVEYKVYACQPNTSMLDTETDLVATVTNATSYEFDYNPNEGEQGYRIFVVTAVNEAGESDAYAEGTSASMTIGAPYDIPYVENFAEGKLHYYSDFVGMGLIYSQSTDGDNSALALASQQENSLVAFTTGKLNIKNASKPTLSVDVMLAGADNFNILVSKNGDTTNPLVLPLPADVVLNGDEFKTIEIDLSSVKDADYIMLAFMARIPTATVIDYLTEEITSYGNALIMDNIRVADKAESGISSVNAVNDGAKTVYTLDGKQVPSVAGKKGIFVIDGKKVMVK